MSDSLIRIYAIARNTLTEALRQKVLNVVFVFGLVMVLGANFISDFSFQEEFKFLKDLAHAAISLTGLMVALIAAAQLIPAEIERRTLYTTLSKPVHRFEFILGKFMGLVSLLTLLVVIMSVAFWGMMKWKEYELIGGVEQVQQAQAVSAHDGHNHGNSNDHNRNHSHKPLPMVEEVKRQARDPGMIQALLLIWVRLCLVAAIAIFFSTFATSTIFIVSCTLFVYLIGNLQAVARQVWLSDEAGAGVFQSILLTIITWLVPDFQAFNLIDEIIATNPVPWMTSLEVTGYAMVYVIVVLILSSLIFEGREF